MWYELCENPQALQRLYDSGEGLDRVHLFEAVLMPDGGLQLRMGLPRFPDHPAPRWPAGANAVQVTVNCWELGGLRLQEWRGDVRGALSLSRGEEGLRLAFQSPRTRLECTCALARIDRVNPYSAWPEGNETP